MPRSSFRVRRLQSRKVGEAAQEQFVGNRALRIERGNNGNRQFVADSPVEIAAYGNKQRAQLADNFIQVGLAKLITIICPVCRPVLSPKVLRRYAWRCRQIGIGAHRNSVAAVQTKSHVTPP